MEFRSLEKQLGRTSTFSAFLAKVFFNLTLGLLLTALTSYFTIASGFYRTLVSNGFAFWGLVILTFVLVIASAPASKNGTVAGIIFYLFSAVEGMLLAPILLVYTGASIAYAFAGASVLFGIMTLLALSGKVDFTRFGTFLFVGLIGIIVVSLLNVFIFHSAGLSFAISILTVLVFLGLTAYDIQKLREIAFTEGNAFFGALMLYLDIINLFLALLEIFGERK